jgi:hypothetical protein
MDSTSRFGYASAQIEQPCTPQPQHSNLPASAKALSPTPLMLVRNQTSPSRSFGVEAITSVRDLSRIKYNSPPLPSSMTPPPSSQPPKRLVPDSPLARATTPTTSNLSSPPSAFMYGSRRETSPGATYTAPTAQQISDASTADLRELLQATIAEVNRLEIDSREARMSAAHYKLQHNLLSIETEEAAKRMEVEHEMTRREVEVLQMAEHARQARQELTSPVNSISGRYILELKEFCRNFDRENALLHQRLERAKKVIAQKDDDLNAILEENRSLVRRIRENREHLNRMKSPGGIYAAATPRNSTNTNFPVTPQQYRCTPKQTPQSMHQDHDERPDSFAALLLADKVLNQENNSAPSTPTLSRQPPRTHIRHSRGVQSLSSLPSKPVQSRFSTENTGLLPPVQLALQSEPRYRTQQQNFSDLPRKERRRKSRDSTISAEDVEDIAAEISNESSDEDITESQASQTATAMLRRDPRESMEVVGSPVPFVATETSSLLQSKILGNITKPGIEKRKRMDDTSDLQKKKMRARQPAIGLGIGSWA